MIFVSAGHCTSPGPNFDPGAPGVDKRWEANETLKVRNRVVEILTQKGYPCITDLDTEKLSQYLERIKTGSGSMVCEFHFNAGVESATGVETLVEIDADKLDLAAAREFSAVTSTILGIPARGNKGVKTEADTRHKRLALMKEDGIVVLVEICFISNPNDMKAFDTNFETLCQAYAELLIKYENMVV